MNTQLDAKDVKFAQCNALIQEYMFSGLNVKDLPIYGTDHRGGFPAYAQRWCHTVPSGHIAFCGKQCGYGYRKRLYAFYIYSYELSVASVDGYVIIELNGSLFPFHQFVGGGRYGSQQCQICLEPKCKHMMNAQEQAILKAETQNDRQYIFIN